VINDDDKKLLNATKMWQWIEYKNIGIIFSKKKHLKWRIQNF